MRHAGRNVERVPSRDLVHRVADRHPRPAGEHADYTEAQLVAFRGGLRTNSAQMTGVAAKMNDREIKAVSDYIAGLR